MFPSISVFLQAQEVPRAPACQACFLLALNLQMSSWRTLLWTGGAATPTQYQSQSWASTLQRKASTGLHPVSLPLLHHLFQAPSGSANRCPRSPWLGPARTFRAAILFQDGKETHKVNLTLFNSMPDLVMRGEKSILPNVTRKQKRRG